MAERVSTLAQLGKLLRKLRAAAEEHDGKAFVEVARQLRAVRLPTRPVANWTPPDHLLRVDLLALLNDLPAKPTNAWFCDNVETLGAKLSDWIRVIDREAATLRTKRIERLTPTRQQMSSIRSAVRQSGKNATVQRIAKLTQIKRATLLAGLKALYLKGEYKGYKRPPK